MAHFFRQDELLVFQLGDLGFKGGDGLCGRGFDQSFQQGILLFVQFRDVALKRLLGGARLIQPLIPCGLEHSFDDGEQAFRGYHAFQDVFEGGVNFLGADVFAIL
ncbi:hypothetical protein [Roseobacter weihaiensis]|uniref:hypothetical protein n=1 Tax=Roseobacter weihaiensis TaxID=2763262 RepID=UPI001D0BCAD9|nr:hypothetical protein [Roseobacter sp. H9]